MRNDGAVRRIRGGRNIGYGSDVNGEDRFGHQGRHFASVPGWKPGYDSSRVVVERNLEIVPQDQLEAVIIQDEDVDRNSSICRRRLMHGSVKGKWDTAIGIDPRDYAGKDF